MGTACKKFIGFMMLVGVLVLLISPTHAQENPIPPYTAISWSPATNWLAVGGTDTILLLDENYTFVNELRLPDAHIISLAWAPDGQKLAAVKYSETSGSRSIFIWDIEADQDRVQWLETNTPTIIEIIWHPSQDYLAFGDWLGNVYLWDIVTDESLAEITPESPYDDPFITQTLCWNQDATGLYSLHNWGAGLHFWEPEVLQVLAPTEFIELNSACSLEANKIIWANGIIQDLTSFTQTKFPEYYQHMIVVKWHPATTYIAANISDGDILVWHYPDLTLKATLTGLTRWAGWDYLDTLAWSPDGQQLATLHETTLQIWETDTFTLVKAIDLTDAERE